MSVQINSNSILRPKDCRSGQGYFDGCNYCTCIDGDEGDLCTATMCNRPLGCEPGEAYFTGREWCFCTSDGPGADYCTTLPCSNTQN